MGDVLDAARGGDGLIGVRLRGVRDDVSHVEPPRSSRPPRASPSPGGGKVASPNTATIS
jgi:hypothetical protein